MSESPQDSHFSHTDVLGASKARLMVERLSQLSMVGLDELRRRLKNPGAQPGPGEKEIADLPLDEVEAALKDATGSFCLEEIEQIWVDRERTAPASEPADSVPTDFDELLDGALQNARQGNATDALTLVRAAEERGPKDVRVHLTAGLIHAALSDPEAALASFGRAKECADDDELKAECLYLLGKVSWAAGRTLEAIDLFREAANLESDPAAEWAGVRQIRGRASHELVRAVGRLDPEAGLTFQLVEEASRFCLTAVQNDPWLFAPAYVDPAIVNVPDLATMLERHFDDISIEANLYGNAGERFLKEIREVGGFDADEFARLGLSFISPHYRGRSLTPKHVLTSVLNIRGGMIERIRRALDETVSARAAAKQAADQQLQAARQEIAVAWSEAERRAAELRAQAQALRAAESAGSTVASQPTEVVPEGAAEVHAEVWTRKVLGMIAVAVTAVLTTALGFVLFDSLLLRLLLPLPILVAVAVAFFSWAPKPKRRIVSMVQELEWQAAEALREAQILKAHRETRSQQEHQRAVNEIEARHRQAMSQIDWSLEALDQVNDRFFGSLGRLDDPEAKYEVPERPKAGD